MAPTAPVTEHQRNDNAVGVVMYLLAALLFALNGVDELGYIMGFEKDIAAFENR